MKKQELKKIRKIYNDINAIAKIGRDNSLEYYKYIDDIVKKSDISFFNACLFLSYGIDCSKFTTIFELKSSTWDIICFQTLTPLDEKLKLLYNKNNVYQLGNDIYSENNKYFDVFLSPPKSFTYSTTDYTSQFLIFENDNRLNIRILDNNLYKIEIYKDYLFQTISSGTYSEFLYNLPLGTYSNYEMDTVKISVDTFRTNITIDTGNYEIITYKRGSELDIQNQINNFNILKYVLNVDLRNRIGSIYEIDSFDYELKQRNSYYDKYVGIYVGKTHFNKDERIDYLMGVKRTYLNSIRYNMSGEIEEEKYFTDINLNYSENSNLYFRYENAISFITKSNIKNTLNDDIYSVWNSESIMYSLYADLHASFNANDLTKADYGDFEIKKVGNILIIPINEIESTGLMKSAYKFNNGYYILPDDNMLFFNFSINTRIFLDNANSIQKIISCYNKYESDTWGWYLELNNGSLSTTYRLSDYKLYTSKFDLPKDLFGTWVSITLVFSNRNYIKYYINGELFIKFLLPSDLDLLYSNKNKCSIGIGSYYKNTEDQLSENNLINSISIWKRELMVEEIKSLDNNGYGLEYPFKNLTESANDWMNYHNATMSNVSIINDGKVGKCFLFGSQSSINFPYNSMDINSFNEFTLSMWLNLKEVGLTQSILKCEDISNNGYNLMVSNLNKIQLEYKNNNYTKLSVGPILEKETWYLINLTFRKDINDKTIFNLFINSNNYLKDILIDNTSSLNMKPIIGSLSEGSKVDSITTWTRCISKNEIVLLYNNGNGKEYPFNLNDNNTVYGSSIKKPDVKFNNLLIFNENTEFEDNISSFYEITPSEDIISSYGKTASFDDGLNM